VYLQSASFDKFGVNAHEEGEKPYVGLKAQGVRLTVKNKAVF
jgi:hypothetical protein